MAEKNLLIRDGRASLSEIVHNFNEFRKTCPYCGVCDLPKPTTEGILPSVFLFLKRGDFMTQKCGYIAILGRPNAGKSSLLNTLVGQKIAGVSNKPQTTRARILGIRLQDRTQMLFLDTPGIHRSVKKVALNSLMNRAAWSVLDQADAVLYLIDAEEASFEDDLDFFRSVVIASHGPVLLCLNKVDKLKREALESPILRAEQLISQVKDSVPNEARGKLVAETPFLISAKRKESLEEILRIAAQVLPEGPWLYPADDLTDRSQKFVCAELIREQAFRCLGAELPYHLAVKVDTIVFNPGIVTIDALIVVGRSQHKGIVVGKGGSKIKELGSKARQSLEKHFEQKVFLELEVTVDSDWVNDPHLVSDYAELEVQSLSNP
jgi:GTP-binding protein Era